MLIMMWMMMMVMPIIILGILYYCKYYVSVCNYPTTYTSMIGQHADDDDYDHHNNDQYIYYNDDDYCYNYIYQYDNDDDCDVLIPSLFCAPLAQERIIRHSKFAAKT